MMKVTLSQINGKLDAFIIQYNLERETDKRIQKEFISFLQKDVSRALNGQKELNNQVAENASKLTELELKDAKCPIANVKNDLERIMSETEESRVIHKYPEIRRSMHVWDVIRSIGLIVLSLSAILSLLISLKIIK